MQLTAKQLPKSEILLVIFLDWVERLNPSSPSTVVFLIPDPSFWNQDAQIIQIRKTFLTDHPVFGSQITGDYLHQDQLTTCKLI